MSTIREHKNIEMSDRRLQAITTLTKPWISPDSGILYDVGTPVAAVGFTRIKSKVLSFGLPSAPALFLDISRTLWLKGDEIYSNGKFVKDSSQNRLSGEDSLLFDLLEFRMGSIVFAYSALEAFANEQIPEDYVYEISTKKCVESYTKEQVERYVPLDEKLKKILPAILSINNRMIPSDKRKIEKLKKLRDRIVHLKSIDRKIVGPEEGKPINTLWSELLEEGLSDPTIDVARIIKFYMPTDISKQPRWYLRFTT